MESRSLGPPRASVPHHRLQSLFTHVDDRVELRQRRPRLLVVLAVLRLGRVMVSSLSGLGLVTVTLSCDPSSGNRWFDPMRGLAEKMGVA